MLTRLKTSGGYGGILLPPLLQVPMNTTPHLDADRLELRSRGVGTFPKERNVRKVQAISREYLVALPVGEPIYDMIVNAVN